MTNEEAKKCLETIDIQSFRDTTESYYFKDINEAKNIAIQALSQPKWIPVTEELPEAGYSVLVTRITNNGDIYEKIASFQEECWMDDNDKYGKPNSDTVLAWMPLPEPYKAESEDEEC